MGADKRPPGPQPTYNQGPPVAAPNQGPSAALPMLPDGNLSAPPCHAFPRAHPARPSALMPRPV
eukprot:CAMPEP_0182858642 /NCGR_PEP_ID=MMETSP0034_2-20130328/3796_1 /TAXON_ID=156128 /ORGANISM="Nephroselmis pyriformis, Strain CCMP717" /LENGTH=63 /DNA_ID=CAMNT_0024990091 /DNA_START=1212 /DNA_END=1403 /DNA_ORIENTATION=+